MAYNPHSYFSFASQEPDSPEGYTITRASFSANFSPSSQSECPDSPDIPQLALPPSVVVNFPSPSASPGPHALDDEGVWSASQTEQQPGLPAQEQHNHPSGLGRCPGRHEKEAKAARRPASARRGSRRRDQRCPPVVAIRDRESIAKVSEHHVVSICHLVANAFLHQPGNRSANARSILPGTRCDVTPLPGPGLAPRRSPILFWGWHVHTHGGLGCHDEGRG